MVNVIKRNLSWGDINMQNLDLVKLVSQLLFTKKAEGKSPKTISWLDEMLTGFIRFLRASGKQAVLAEFNANTVREFIVHEQGRNLSPFTVQAKVRAVKVLASWLFSEGYTPDNVLINVKLPKTPQQLVEILTDAEIDALLGAQNPLTALGSRNIAILIMLLDGGCRLNELANLRFEDVHLEEGFIKINGKGNKERVVHMGNRARKTLYRYILHFRPEPITQADNVLFLTLDGRRLSANAIKLILNRWGKRAGVSRLHAHLCRHTYATNFLTHKCGDLFDLQGSLGHTTLEMVRRYVHYSSAQQMLQGRISSPLDHANIKKLRGYIIDRHLKKNGGQPL